MERHIARSAEQAINEPGEEETHEAGKGLAERVLEALLGAEGEEMVVRAKEMREAIRKAGGDVG